MKVADPIALKHVENRWKDVQLCANGLDTVRGSDCLFLITDWPEFIHLDWEQVYKLMHAPTDY